MRCDLLLDAPVPRMDCLRCQRYVICLLMLPGVYNEEIIQVLEETLDFEFSNNVETERLWGPLRAFAL